EGRPLQLSADVRLLRAGWRGAREASGHATRLRHGQPAPRRPQCPPPGRDRRAAERRLLEQRRSKSRELLLQVGRHLLDDRLAHEAPELDLELVALAAVAAVVEVLLRLDPLRVAQV